MPSPVARNRRGRPATGTAPHFAVRLPREVIAAMDRLATAESRPRSEIAREALTEHLRAKGYLT
ncbi:ribbon-helix-helix protein, CopG family [Methylobacterium crusticola]